MSLTNDIRRLARHLDRQAQQQLDAAGTTLREEGERTADLAVSTHATTAGVHLSAGDRAKLDAYPAVSGLTVGHVLTASSASGAAFAALPLSVSDPAALGAAAAPGVGTSLARADHVHIRPTPAELGALSVSALSDATPAALAAAGSAGVSSSVSRADHVHAHNPPTFAVNKNADQTGVTPFTFTKITWETVLIDTRNALAASRYSPTVAGLYLLTATIIFYNDLSANKEIILSLYKNGARHREARSNFKSLSTTAVVQANGTSDYFEVYVYHTDTVNHQIFSGQAETHWSGIWIAP